jgi:hypothetical protein
MRRPIRLSMILPALTLLFCSMSVFGQRIEGCTSDERTGVCNKSCRVSHVEGCTLEQFQPLASIHSMDCLSNTVNLDVSNEDKAIARDECSKQTDKMIQEWKVAQKKKPAAK